MIDGPLRGKDASRRETGLYRVPVIWHDIERHVQPIFDPRIRHTAELRNCAVVILSKGMSARLQTGDNRQPRRGRCNREDIEVRTVMPETKHGLPNVAGMEFPLPFRSLRDFIQRHCVVQQHGRSRTAVGFDVDEILERLLKDGAPSMNARRNG